MMNTPMERTATSGDSCSVVKGARMAGIAAILILAACSSVQTNLVETGSVKLDIKKSHPVRISNATVYQEVGRIVIRGEARYPIFVDFGMFPGHVDIEVELPNGSTIERHSVRLVLKRIPKKSGRRASFTTSFQLELPKNTAIRIAYDEGTHSEAIGRQQSDHPCASSVATQVQALGIKLSAVKYTWFVSQSADPEGVVQGYNAWVGLDFCKGHLVVESDEFCRPLQIYTKGGCRVAGTRSTD